MSRLLYFNTKLLGIPRRGWGSGGMACGVPAPALRFYCNTGTPQTALDAGGCESGVRSPRLAGTRLFPNTERAPALAGNRLKKLPACFLPNRHQNAIAINSQFRTRHLTCS
ncbi:MAG: hypothetical protein KME26_29870 [Oscillatoria princeps RMCB-10]|nr:hypothetical protein [Oscillatoria princeps RMCB-10]